MHAKSLEQCRATLVLRKEELQNRMRSAKLAFQESPPHRTICEDIFSAGERSAEETIYRIEQALIKKDIIAVEAIEASLKKIEAGTYGICTLCTKEIPAIRMRAIPEASRCLQCQTFVEHPLSGA